MNLIGKNKVFIKYILSAGTSFFLDLFLFSIFNYIFSFFFEYESIIVSTICARILSSLYNFIINSKLVFRKFSRTMIIKYYVLVFIQMCLSSILVYLINKFLIYTLAVIIKFFVDIILFIVNYFIQKIYIFK